MLKEFLKGAAWMLSIPLGLTAIWSLGIVAYRLVGELGVIGLLLAILAVVGGALQVHEARRQGRI